MPFKLAWTGATIFGVARSGKLLRRLSLVVVVLGVGRSGLQAEDCGDGLGFFCCVAVGEEVSLPPCD
jgi:hypothetical protein